MREPITKELDIMEELVKKTLEIVSISRDDW
jgi:hypothetical protein